MVIMCVNSKGDCMSIPYSEPRIAKAVQIDGDIIHLFALQGPPNDDDVINSII